MIENFENDFFIQFLKDLLGNDEDINIIEKIRTSNDYEKIINELISTLDEEQSDDKL